jgi:diguanylate cyclase (GGDEF)-like protein/PAS domain S-box-containing protein
MDIARLAYWEADGTTETFTFNDAFYDLIGTTAEREGGYTVEAKQYFKKFVHPDDLSKVHRYVEGLRANTDSDRSDDFDARIVRGDGEVRHILTRLRVFRGPAGQGTKLFGINQDITDRKKTEEALKESETRFRGAFEASGIGMVLVSLDHRWLKVNQSFCDMIGYSEEELLAKTFENITHPDDLKHDLEYVQRLIDDQIPYYRLEKRYYHRDGYIVWGALSVSLVRDARGYPLYFVGQIEDITEKKLLEEKLQTRLITDELTGLYNRRGFFELASERLRPASENKNRHVLFFANLDHVKWINDTLGHQDGDAALATVARLLKDTFQESDIIGRLGGVEFAVLASAAAEDEEDALLARLHHNIEKFNSDHTAGFPISLSIGCACHEPEDPRQLETLLAEADESLYEKKLKAGGLTSDTYLG